MLAQESIHRPLVLGSRQAHKGRVVRPTRQQGLQVKCFFSTSNNRTESSPRTVADNQQQPAPWGSTYQGWSRKVTTLASVSGVGLTGGGFFGGSNGGGSNSGGGGGGGEWSFSSPGGSQPASNVLADIAAVETADMVEEVILLDVGGMKCGGCVSHVQKVLESQPNVAQVTVNLATETALVRVLVPKGSGSSSEGGMSPHLRAVGDKLVQVVTGAGFTCRVSAKKQQA
mmetsp:Transcript_32907/g.72683  ORF Transcript_32907/g.72683 Transcript_32907/m.72683 type:complete len:228 (+) Transcript_32907:144-827(+)|eukprot:CAMPEP_0202902812 /NCGR_PEP_ID=MMETSP1392-20130828/17064_1 /ASSEMBLY_ACC=CAM_ASM_000868 /TAXON_ID=225041 /ORGANISM="Chlamydomonas chlamydogama, Strain SAG 11-48b" /LENGTH=227 /DNA_ID=CAMNT_0049589619 /DNA_START=228 /DNA_END=911 /DNA_ORIENTATION=-